MSLAPDPVLLDVSPAGVAVLTLNRPEKHNSFDELMIANLSEHLETLKGADHVRVVLLRGAGDVFCAGADVDWLRRGSERTFEDNEADALSLARMLKHLHDLPQLTLALVRGAAEGVGAGLVAACDVAVSLKSARFCFPEVRLGLTPATAAPYVIEAIGARWAKALFTTAESFDGAFAEKMGLVQYAVADEAELQATAEMLTELVLTAAPSAITDAKALVRHVAGRKIDDTLGKDTAHRFAQRRASREGKEGLAAFLEKRKPDWAS